MDAVRVPAWTWRDLISFLALLVSGLIWGLKIESRIDREEATHADQMRDVERRIATVEGTISAGVLPRTDERLRGIERRLDNDEKDIDRIDRVEVKLGPLRRRWEFFTKPLVFYVIYNPPKDEWTDAGQQRFFDEQLAAVRRYLSAQSELAGRDVSPQRDERREDSLL
jgi:hypothetical protein